MGGAISHARVRVVKKGNDVGNDRLVILVADTELQQGVECHAQQGALQLGSCGGGCWADLEGRCNRVNQFSRQISVLVHLKRGFRCQRAAKVETNQ